MTTHGPDRFVLPAGTTAQRPSGAAPGTLRYNSEYNIFEFQNSTSWIAPGFPDGSTALNSATSATAIKNLTGTTTNGFYFIKINGIPTQVYCDMQNDGGGWMLAQKTWTSTDRWYYDDPYWTNTTVLNETNNPETFNGHIKTNVYTSVSFSSVRLAGGSISNGLVESTWNGSSFASWMTTGHSSSNSKTAWVNWMTSALGADPLAQSNCNQFGNNLAYNYMYVRLGGAFNNEADCTTNDSGLGWGIKGISPYTNVNPFGAFSSSGRNQNAVGWIFIK